MIDFLIIGQGLSGTLVAKQLLESGCSVRIIDNPDHSASLVASGLMNPVIGKRFTLSDSFIHQKQIAEQQYSVVEHAYHSIQIYRYLYNYDEIQRWEKQRAFLGSQSMAYEVLGNNQEHELLHQVTQPPERILCYPHAARLHTGVFLEYYRKYFKELGIITEQEFSPTQLHIHNNYIEYDGNSYSNLIMCDGWRSMSHELFSYVPTVHAKGEFINVTIPSIKKELYPVIISNGKYLAQMHGSTFRFGATYIWNFTDVLPSTQSIQQLTTELQQLVHVPFTIQSALAGVRPVVKDIMPVIGRHKDYTHIYTLNGLGSKGALLAPYASHLLVEFILRAKRIPPKLDIARFHT